MKLQDNLFKARLRDGIPQIGIWSSMCSEIAADILATAGFDWVLIDMEHSVNDLASVVAQMRAYRGSATHPVVRPPVNEPVIVKRLLDQGVFSLLFPMVQSADEARAAVQACRYPPRGIRGLSLNHRGNHYGAIRDEYLARAEDQIQVLVQIESRSALSVVDEIAAVDGVDGVFFGPADLSADLGVPGEIAHADVVAAIRHGVSRVRQAGKPAGILVSDPAQAEFWLAEQLLFVACGSDQGLLASGARSLRSRIRQPE